VELDAVWMLFVEVALLLDVLEGVASLFKICSTGIGSKTDGSTVVIVDTLSDCVVDDSSDVVAVDNLRSICASDSSTQVAD
jgi:hypothetical protein